MAPKTEETLPEYKNDQVNVVVHHKPNCVVEYEVEAAGTLCQEAKKKAARSVGKEVVVPGFRKGKAPLPVVEKRYPQELDKRWQEQIANAAFRQSAELAQVPLIHQDASISFKMDKHSSEGAKLTLSFETLPNIPSVDPAKCVLEEVKRPDTSKEKVDETIRQTQMFFAKWIEVDDHPVGPGDFLLLDIELMEDDPPQKVFNNTRFEVADKSMAKWMQELVIGKKKGDVMEGVSKPDDNATEEEKKDFPPKKVRVTINAVEKVELPELNDNFAAQLGVASVADLHQQVEALLNKKADQHVREIKREKVTEFLLSQPFDMPSSVIEKETQFRLQQMIQDPGFKKQWDGSTDDQKRETVDNVKKQAEKAVRIFYVCRKIAADQKITITPEDLPAENPTPLEQLLYPNSQPHDPRQPDIKQAEAYSRVLLEKTEDWVISHARTAPRSMSKKDDEPKAADKPAAKKAAPKKKAAAKKAAPKKTAGKTAAKKKASPEKK